MSGWWPIRLNNAFVFPNPDPLVINIPYGWSGISGQFGLCSFMFSLVLSSKLIFVCVVILSHLITSFYMVWKGINIT